MPGIVDRFRNLHINSRRHMDAIPPSPRERLRYFRESRRVREETFTKNGWPLSAPVSVEDLLDDGFFYVGCNQDDRVQCSYCGNVLRGFRQGDNVHIEHYRHFPNCDRFNEVDDKYRHLFYDDDDLVTDGDIETDGPDDLEVDGLADGTVADDLEVDGLADRTVADSVGAFGYSKPDASRVKKPEYRPRHKYYGTLMDRLKTYRTWPKGQQPDPNSLAEAGLFYTGTGDCCECFYCGGQLEQWEEGDVPQHEHDANFFDICPLAKKK